MRGRMMAETDRGRWGQESEVSSNGDRGERRERDGLGESNGVSEGWSGRSKGDSTETETEEYGMTAGEPEGSRDMLTASPWGTQEIGTRELQGGTRAGESDTGKSSAAAAVEEGPRGRHGARLGQGKKTEASRKIKEA